VPREASPAHRLLALVKGSDLCYELLECYRIAEDAMLDLLLCPVEFGFYRAEVEGHVHLGVLLGAED
jgi:hypothetical protein